MIPDAAAAAVTTRAARGAGIRSRLDDHTYVALIGALLALDGAVVAHLAGVPFLWDAASYWRLDMANLYGAASQSLIAPQGFRYSPAFAQLVAPLGALPWPVYAAVYVAAMGACLLAIGRRFTWALLLMPAVLIELRFGNIHLFLAAAIAFSFRWPALWSVVILTKVTPGVGILWFAFRREWRSFGVAVGATGAIAAVSAVLAPDLWAEWIAALRSMAALPEQNSLSYGPLVLRLVVAVAVLAVAARANARWAVPLAALIAMPTIWVMSWTILAAATMLHRRGYALAIAASAIPVMAWLIGPAY